MTNEQIAISPDPSDISHDASFWFARLRSDDYTEQDQQQFADWLARDPVHEQQYDQYCLMWSKLGELSGEPEIVQMRLEALAYLPAKRVIGRWRWPALAASILVMLIIGIAVPRLGDFGIDSTRSEAQASRIASKSPEPAPPPIDDELGPIELASTYSTPVGGHSAFTLPDGSVIELNTNTRIRVIYTEHRRDLDLLRGEAIFRVAKNPNRPFVVMTNNNRVTAVGTAFVVRRDSKRTTVTLLEGKVKVEQFADNAPSGTVAQVTDLVAGQQLQTSTNADYQVRYADTKEASSWAKGRLSFDNRRLAEVIAELNRYTTRPMILGEASLADLRISGQFRTASADTFAQTLAESFPVEIAENGKNGSIVLRRGKRKDMPK